MLMVKNETKTKFLLKNRRQKGFIFRCLLFIIIAFILIYLITILFEKGYLYPVIYLTTLASAYLMGFFGIPVQYGWHRIFLESRTLEINLECTALFLIAIYISLVIVFPSSIKKKISGILFGVPVLIGVNLIRLLLIALISERLPAYFEISHDYIWQAIFVLIVTAMWFLFIGKEKEKSPDEA